MFILSALTVIIEKIKPNTKPQHWLQKNIQRNFIPQIKPVYLFPFEKKIQKKQTITSSSLENYQTPILPKNNNLSNQLIDLFLTTTKNNNSENSEIIPTINNLLLSNNTNLVEDDIEIIDDTTMIELTSTPIITTNDTKLTNFKLPNINQNDDIDSDYFVIDDESHIAMIEENDILKEYHVIADEGDIVVIDENILKEYHVIADEGDIAVIEELIPQPLTIKTNTPLLTDFQLLSTNKKDTMKKTNEEWEFIDKSLCWDKRTKNINNNVVEKISFTNNNLPILVA